MIYYYYLSKRTIGILWLRGAGMRKLSNVPHTMILYLLALTYLPIPDIPTFVHFSPHRLQSDETRSQLQTDVYCRTQAAL